MIAAALKEDGVKLVKKVGGVFRFVVTKGPSGKEDYWVVDAKNGEWLHGFLNSSTYIVCHGVRQWDF